MPTTYSNSSSSATSYKRRNEEVDKAFTTLSIFLLVAATWIATSVVVYGTKTGRWKKKARASSLNNGVIYVACTIAIGLSFPSSIMSVIVCQMQDNMTGTICNSFYSIYVGTSMLSSWASCTFIWFRQRVIYHHPYVNPRVSKWANWLSRLLEMLLSLVCLAAIVTFLVPKSFHTYEYGCFRSPLEKSSFRLIAEIFIPTWVLIQLLLAVMSIYPAIIVRFQRAQSEPSELDVNMSTCSDLPQGSRRHILLLCNTATIVSPIHMAVRRCIWCSFIMTFVELTFFIALNLIQSNITLYVETTIFSIVAALKLFLMIFTFSFSSRVFTVLWINCERSSTSNASRTVNGLPSTSASHENGARAIEVITLR